VGNVTASIWRSPGEKGDLYKTTYQASYQDGSGECKTLIASGRLRMHAWASWASSRTFGFANSNADVPGKRSMLNVGCSDPRGSSPVALRSLIHGSAFSLLVLPLIHEAFHVSDSTASRSKRQGSMHRLL
jgi:hypothetical protein